VDLLKRGENGISFRSDKEQVSGHFSIQPGQQFTKLALSPATRQDSDPVTQLLANFVFTFLILFVHFLQLQLLPLCYDYRTRKHLPFRDHIFLLAQ
jgi:hypothetical protein